jgi:kynurenine formamidase
MRQNLIACVVLVLFASLSANAQSWQPPAEPQRCPSRWGAGDERGAGKQMNSETVLKALRLVKTGEVIELGHVLASAMPLSEGRRFQLDTKRTNMNPLSNQRGGNEEVITAEMGQVGTQLDGFAHQTIGNSMYNCFKVDDISTRNGFSKLGIQNVGAIVARGVLIDIAALKGVEMLADSYEVTLQDVQQALALQKLTLQPGDAVLIHTGYGKLWQKDNARYQRGNPGIGVAAGEWLAGQRPILVGADTPPVEVNPNPDPKISLPIHQIMLVVNGIHLLENLKLDELAAKRVYEFALIVEPLKIQGGTGSTVAPVAIH